jgi:hypothetical protein
MNPNESEWLWRQAQWERLIAILDEADAIQQRLLGDEHEAACYEFHNQLNNLVDEFEQFAAADEQSWQETAE